jgi:transposase InsO family protein
MPFVSVSAMDNRRHLVWQIAEGGISLSEACRQAGVSRKTGRKWVDRAGDVGIENIAELSRAPKRVPKRTNEATERALLELKGAYPEWGARKLVVLLRRDQGIELPSRTADHILSRYGLTSPRPKAAPRIRFERDECGALLQMDFKGLPQGTPYALLSVLDDHGRFCLSFEPVPDKTGKSVKAVLWEVFGEHGLPASMLMDNGDCWGAPTSKVPTAFCVWLMKLGIHPIHGRPCHPQTQGKVERFHKTAKLEMGHSLVQPSIDLARTSCKSFVDRYNWLRPHDSLGGATPGSLYERFSRKRPASLPKHEIPEGTPYRLVDPEGRIYYKGRQYKVGKGLSAEHVVLKEDEFGMRLFFMDYPLPYLFEL